MVDVNGKSTEVNEPRSEVYCTLLLNDEYLPGALVLASQLRQFDPTRPIVCLIARSSDSTGVSPQAIDSLREVFDELVPVDPIDASDSPELSLLGRPDLRLATTKLRLWELPYSRVVYLDADMLPIKSIADLFNLPLPSSRSIGAAPDCGWPDMFNSGLLTLKPDAEVAKDLIDKNKESSCIDGADQGLLNEELDWVRIPFVYNVTVNASYEYLPAYRRFKNDVRTLHFIGTQKPWKQARGASDEIGRWWRTAEQCGISNVLNLDSMNSLLLGSNGASAGASANSSAPNYDPDLLIETPPDYWNPLTHPPLRKSRPEGEALSQYVAHLSLNSSGPTETPIPLGASNGNAEPLSSRKPKTVFIRTDGEANNNREADNTLESKHTQLDPIEENTSLEAPRHVFPRFGPTIVRLPFETSRARPPVERQF